MIVIGLGAGRSGTASLARFLSQQRNAFCFHEMNPSCVAFRGTPRPIENTIEEFQRIIAGGDPARLTLDLSRQVVARDYEKLRHMSNVELIGDVAFYYLAYIELIASMSHEVRFICLRRDRASNIKSWLRKASIRRWTTKHVADRLSSLITRTPFYSSHNYWMNHNGQRWKKDPVWDKCFPSFDAESIEEAVAAYYDYYYSEALRIESTIGSRFLTIDMENLGELTCRRSVLRHCGVQDCNQALDAIHIHQAH